MTIFTVTTLSDETFDNNGNDATDGTGLSLREAIGLASISDSEADTIVFDASLGGGTMEVLEGGVFNAHLNISFDASLTGTLTIDGDVNGDNIADITLDGTSSASRSFSVTGAATNVTLDAMVVTGGQPGQHGGGISNTDSTLFLENMTVEGNIARFGGGIYNYNGDVTLTNSIVRNNVAPNSPHETSGGGIYSRFGSLTLIGSTVSNNIIEGAGTGAGIQATETNVTLINSTIANNSFPNPVGVTEGGGLQLWAGFPELTVLKIINSTISGNSADYGGGVRVRGSALYTIENSIILGNTGDSLSEAFFGNYYYSSFKGQNIVGQTSDDYDAHNLDELEEDAQVINANPQDVFAQTNGVAGVLADNGGPVPTIALAAGSSNPALDAATSSLSTDARGEVRAFDQLIVADGLGTVDLGAYELTSMVKSVPSITLQSVPSVTEDTQNNAINGAAVADADGDNQTVSLTVTGGTVDMLTAGVTMTVGDGDDDANLTFSGSLANINTALDSLTFTPTADLSGTGVASIQIQTNDGSGGTDDKTLTFDIAALDDVPTLAGITAQSAFQGIAKDLNLSVTSINDVDTPALTVTLSVDTGTLTAAATGMHGSGATVAQTNATTITLTGTGAQISAYLDDTDEVSFTSAASLADVTLTVSVDDGVNPAVTDTATISITDGDTPSATTASYNGTEDTAVDLATAGMAVNQDAVASDALNYITITDITGGTLALGAEAAAKGGDGVTDMAAVGAITVGSLINPTDIARLTFIPTGNSTSAASITYSVTDTGGDVSPDATLTINLAAVNDAPTASDNTLTMNEDTSRILTVADFNFADVDTSDTLQSVRIDTMTVNSGAFLLSGTPVAAPQVITVADLNGGALVYTPAANANGDGLLSLTFSVNDGMEFAASTSTLTVNVADVAEPVVVVTPPPTDSGPGTTPPEPPAPVVVNRDNTDTTPDAVEGTAADDIVQAGGGNDTVSGGAGSDNVDGGSGNDMVDGGEGDDTLLGGDGDDSISGGDGQDTAFAGQGDTGNDTVDGGAGNDVVGAGAGNDRIDAGAGADIAFASDGEDFVDGGAGNDTLFGGAGDDTVIGGAGDDNIWAGAGDDLLTGGEGADTFIFGAKSGNDTVTDFDVSEDVINLSFAPASFVTFEDVIAAASNIVQGGEEGVLLNLGDNQSVFISGIGLDDLTIDNIIL